MKFKQYGSNDGKTVIYFHGAPGAASECEIFDKHAKAHGLKVICFDRFSVEQTLQGEAYYRYLAQAIKEQVNNKPVDLIGFSIGCHAAIKTAYYLKNQLNQLHLISAAAPLECGNYLNAMAGKTVFSLAIKQPAFFKLLSYWQALLTKISPLLLYKILFASAAADDIRLSQSKGFQSLMLPVLAFCFGQNIKGYLREIQQYVTPWEDALQGCNANTFIWHGEQDNWSPVAMANFLAKKLATTAQLTTIEGLSHYSCLYAAAPSICQKIAAVNVAPINLGLRSG